MNKKAQALLEKQMELLAKRSEDCVEDRDLPALTNAMLEISDALPPEDDESDSEKLSRSERLLIEQYRDMTPIMRRRFLKAACGDSDALRPAPYVREEPQDILQYGADKETVNTVIRTARAKQKEKLYRTLQDAE